MALVKYHNLTAVITVITDYALHVIKTLYTDANPCDISIKDSNIGL